MKSKRTLFERMGRYWFFSLLALMCGLPWSMNLWASEFSQGWEIDRELKFHLATFDEEESGTLVSGDWEPVSAEKLRSDSKPYAPDIDNIDLEGIRDLGFPLPARPGSLKHTFYLKFFKFPARLLAQASARQAMKGLPIFRSQVFSKVSDFINRPENLLIKKGFIAETGQRFTEGNPYPMQLVPTHGILKTDQGISSRVIPSQELFDNKVVFCSLYLKNPRLEGVRPIDKDRYAAATADSIRAFMRDLFSELSRNEVRGPEKEKYRYFLIEEKIPETLELPRLTLLKIPREPMIFKNYRDLPMPLDPGNMFLSGLLLIYRTDYQFNDAKVIRGETLILGAPVFHSLFEPVRSSVIEIGSVVKFTSR